MRETWFQSLDWEDPLEKEKTTHTHMPLTWKANQLQVRQQREGTAAGGDQAQPDSVSFQGFAGRWGFVLAALF